MLRWLICLCLAGPAMADPVQFRESIRVEGREFPVPMAVNLRALSETRVAMSFHGNLTALQDALPGLLSREVESTCDERTAVRVDDVVAEGPELVLRGRMQYRRWSCNGGDYETRSLQFSQSADVFVRMAGEIMRGCLVMQVSEALIEPDGLAGALLDASGLTERLTRELAGRMNESLAEDAACLEIPEEFQAFDAVVTGGGFRDLGNGRIGAVIHSAMDVNAENFIRLVHLLGREGRLGE